MKNLGKLVQTLCKYPDEAQWFEFKHNNYDPEMIGRDISALANGAALEKRERAYLLWGIDDKTHRVVGTTKDLQSIKIGREELENWLRRSLSPNADFRYHKISLDGMTVGVLVIRCAVGIPVTFQKAAYVRVGSYTKRSEDYPAVEADLWRQLQSTKFEEGLAKEDLTMEEAMDLVDWRQYSSSMEIVLPRSAEGIARYLTKDGILSQQDNGLYAVTNMGAVLFARRLEDFPTVSRRAVRVIRYAGDDRMEISRKDACEGGYAVEFQDLIRSIEEMVSMEKITSGGVRRKALPYPHLAIREAVANALIHQDFWVKGAGPMVEIFDKRIEITNPGTPLVDIDRIINDPPRSRNERLSKTMYRLGMCEEAGTGWDKIVSSCESEWLPAPKIEEYPTSDSTRVTLFSEMPFSSIAQEDKLRACYLHACILYTKGEQLTNSSLRERFKIEASSAASISRLIKDAVEKEYIKAFDPLASKRYMKYVPIWA